jgi:diaminopimelate dehydrogenase
VSRSAGPPIVSEDLVRDRSGLTRPRVAVVGLGRLGQACAAAILAADDLTLAGIVRRAETRGCPRPAPLRAIPVVSEPGALDGIEAALLCVPAALVGEAAHGLLQHGTRIVECAALEGDALRAHHQALDRAAWRHRIAAVVGAGWDPGMLAVLRGLFAVVIPRGHTETRRHAGGSLHHTLAVQRVAGVEDAVCTEVSGADGAVHRYVYVELAPGADGERVAQAIRADPLFLGGATTVLPVDSTAALEGERQGITVTRRGTSGPTAHQSLLLEARFDPVVLAAQAMVAGVRALRTLPAGAHALHDLSLRALWPEARGASLPA